MFGALTGSCDMEGTAVEAGLWKKKVMSERGLSKFCTSFGGCGCGWCKGGGSFSFDFLRIRIWKSATPYNIATFGLESGYHRQLRTLLARVYVYFGRITCIHESWPCTSSVNSGFASTKGRAKIKVSSGFVTVKFKLNWPRRRRDYPYRHERRQRAHRDRGDYHAAN